MTMDRDEMRNLYEADAIGVSIADEAPAPTHARTGAGGYMVFKATRRQRLAYWLGFNRYPFTDMPAHAERLPGWALSEIRVKVSFTDRVRLLISGRAFIRVEQRFDAVVTEVATVSAFAVTWRV